jgi:MFS family permease
VNFRFFVMDFRVSSRKFLAATLLNAGTLSWFFLLNNYSADIFKSLTPNESISAYYNIGQILFYGFAVFWAIVGSLIGGKINRRNFLFSWISLGVFATITLAVFQGTIFSIISSALLGLSLGLGLPMSMAFVAECTAIEGRGRVSGTIILGTFVLAIITTVIVRVLSVGILGAIILLAVVRSISFLALILDKCDKQIEEATPRLQRTTYKEFGFYLFPWVMFCVASGLAWNLIPDNPVYATAVSIGLSLRYVCIAIFSLVSGIVADRFGRKQPIIIGLIILGVSFGILGFAGMSDTSVLIYLTASGVAWSSFFVVFLTVPGDLSNSPSREKFYAIGTILPLVVFFSFSLIPGSAIFSTLSAGSFSQILSIIVILSIIPVLRAKETLPESKTRERKMKEYVNKVGELIEETKKTK